MPLSSLPNCRDLGGLRAADGRVIRGGFLIRSAALSSAGQEELAFLRDRLHLQTVLDLRTPEEASEAPDAQTDGISIVPLPLVTEAQIGMTREKNTDERATSGSGAASLPSLRVLYGLLIQNPECQVRLGEAARLVMEACLQGHAVLWHCTEGKDRCGILTMVLLSSLGVSRDVILGDYLKTNLYSEKRAEGMYHRALQGGAGEQAALAVRDLFLAKEEYLQAAFLEIDRLSGSTDVYLEDRLQLPRELLQAFREAMLTEGGETV
ncbi:MAG: tyrosine-protein phosphatase [Clostridia bacterium]|nr:tyrosine-protein phosphatase [Clostridia bacterium]